MAPTLISATPSAYARINRIAFMEKGVDFELKNEVPWNSDTETPKFNPLEKLPILILDDGTWIYDSSHIQEYILHKYADKGPSLLPEGWDATFQAKQIQVLAQGHMDAMALRFFEVSRAEHGSSTYMGRQDRKIAGAVKAYSEFVKTANGGYLVSNTYSIADIAVGCAIEWVDFFGVCKGWKEEYPELAAWWAKLSQRETFQQTVPVMFDMKDRVV